MNIRDLYFFIKVYECRSISIASEKLFISAQGLSNVISRLEQELGCSLFNRDRAGSVPTVCGEAFYKYAVKTKSEYERMITEIEHLSRAEKGVIRIGYSFGVMSGLTMNITQEFQNNYPEYELDFAEMPDKIVEELVLSEELDIGFAAYVDKDKFEYDLMNESEILFVPIKDSKAVAEKMMWFVEHPMAIETMGEESITLVKKKFDVHKVNSHMMEIMGV